MSDIHPHPYLHTDKYSCWMDDNKSYGNQGTSHKSDQGLPLDLLLIRIHMVCLLIKTSE